MILGCFIMYVRVLGGVKLSESEFSEFKNFQNSKDNIYFHFDNSVNFVNSDSDNFALKRRCTPRLHGNAISSGNAAFHLSNPPDKIYVCDFPNPILEIYPGIRCSRMKSFPPYINNGPVLSNFLNTSS